MLPVGRDAKPEPRPSSVLPALPSAMGIGRFAFTPLFPLMQDSAGITLAQASWIASANYLGYLVGAVASYVAAVKAPLAARWGLVVVAASTLLTAFADTVARWVVLRLVAGAASAFVLIGASAWALALLARSQRLRWSGWVFAGVGVGICLAGVTALVVATGRASARLAWVGLGVLPACVAALGWRALATMDAAVRPARQRGLRALDAPNWAPIPC